MTKEEIWERLETEFKLRGYSQKSIGTYKAGITTFLDWANKPYEDLDEEDFRNYLIHIIQEGRLKPQTINSKNSAIRFFLVVILGKNINPNDRDCCIISFLDNPEHTYPTPNILTELNAALTAEGLEAMDIIDHRNGTNRSEVKNKLESQYDTCCNIQQKPPSPDSSSGNGVLLPREWRKRQKDVILGQQKNYSP